jgi:hypothetical protein
MVEIIDLTLATMLNLSNRDLRVISVNELKALLQSCLQWDCMSWMQQWIEGEGRKINLKWLDVEMSKNGGFKVLVEKAREYVLDVVGVLVWWGGERRMDMEIREAANSAPLLVS